MKTIVLAVAVLVVLPAVCQSQEQDSNSNSNSNTGSYLLEKCTQLVRLVDDNFDPKSEADVHAARWCLGYMDGFVDGISAVENYETFRSWQDLGKSHSGVCFPGASTIIQDVRTVVKYLQDHPEELHKDKGELTLKALQKAYPCKPAKDHPKE